MSHNDTLCRRYQGLKVFGDPSFTRYCYPVATDEIVFKGLHEGTPRAVGEVIEVIESTLGAKFALTVQADPQHALEGADGRLNSPSRGLLATIEVWSLEPGSYDMVLKIPNSVTENFDATSALVGRFVDRARAVSGQIDSLDLLRFEAGPALSLKAAQKSLRNLEEKSGTQLDTQTLLSFLKLDRPGLPN